jgi:hypothetical protein
VTTSDADRGPELQRMTIAQFIERELASGQPRTVVDEYYGVSWTPQQILNAPPVRRQPGTTGARLR